MAVFGTLVDDICYCVVSCILFCNFLQIVGVFNDARLRGRALNQLQQIKDAKAVLHGNQGTITKLEVCWAF